MVWSRNEKQSSMLPFDRAEAILQNADELVFPLTREPLEAEQVPSYFDYWKKKWQETDGLESRVEWLFRQVMSTVCCLIKQEFGFRVHAEQVVAGIMMCEGKLAEMKTGEGKTIAAIFPAVWQALRGEAVHVLTVNSYLVERDAELAKRIFRHIGLRVGMILPSMMAPMRSKAYRCDVTYVTHTEFGFDYLRDQLVMDPLERVQRGLTAAVVDEADSVLIDEARTPLILSGSNGLGSEYLRFVHQMVQRLVPGEDFQIEPRSRRVQWNDQGYDHCEQIFRVESLHAPGQVPLLHAIVNAILAQHAYQLDVDYVLGPDPFGETAVILVDQNTGRLMHGRRLQEGLHEALEAKEGIQIHGDGKMLAVITIQHLFRQFAFLCGMTGTAMAARKEFEQIYRLETVQIPTHCAVQRIDSPDRLFVTEEHKWQAVIEKIQEVHAKGQPILVGTPDIKRSEMVSKRLEAAGVPHRLLNAKNDLEEAEVVTAAGQAGAITISTNMAGRGVDIRLVEGVAEKGGLFVLGTTRFHSKRVDEQLRGRSGRQGDPGESQFFVSLEDDLVFKYASDALVERMETAKFPENGEIEEQRWHRAVDDTQKTADREGFEIRQLLLGFDDIIALQRDWIYGEREKLLVMQDMRSYVEEIVRKRVKELVFQFCEYDEEPESWDLIGLMMELTAMFPPHRPFVLKKLHDIDRKELIDQIVNDLIDIYTQLRDPHDNGWVVEQRQAFLRTIDARWISYIEETDDLKKGILLRKFANESPLFAFQKETASMVERLMILIQEDAVRWIWDQIFRFTTKHTTV